MGPRGSLNFNLPLVRTNGGLKISTLFFGGGANDMLKSFCLFQVKFNIFIENVFASD